jgi:ribosome modulation factor
MGRFKSLYDAIAEGVEAGMNGRPETECPVDQTAEERAFWIMGYQRASLASRATRLAAEEKAATPENSKQPEFTSVAELRHVVDANSWKFKEAMWKLKWDNAVLTDSRKVKIGVLSDGLDCVRSFRDSNPNIGPELAARIDAFEGVLKKLGAPMVCGTVTSGEWLG